MRGTVSKAPLLTVQEAEMVSPVMTAVNIQNTKEEKIPCHGSH